MIVVEEVVASCVVLSVELFFVAIFETSTLSNFRTAFGEKETWSHNTHQTPMSTGFLFCFSNVEHLSSECFMVLCAP